MRTLDLDQIRPLLAEFTLTVDPEKDMKQTYQVFRPTLRQKLVHRAELDEVIKSLKKLENKDGSVKQPEYDQAIAKWTHRQIEIFIPGFKREHADLLVDEQREAIMNLVFDLGEPEPEEPGPKKKVRGQGSRGVK